MNKSINEIITIIIVLYKQNLVECLTYQTLIKSLKLSKINYVLIIYNNSSDINIPMSTDYNLINSKDNGKLFKAYNYALNYSIQIESKWLLLLDQDTEVTSEYIDKLYCFLKEKMDTNTVAATPILKDGSKILSPKNISSFCWWQYDIKNLGFQKGRIAAFNSLTLISTQFMQSIGGFSSEYPLDMLDHWYYNQIWLQNKNVYVLDAKINHTLSLLNYEENVSLKRHEDFLEAERKFISNEFSLFYYITYKFRLTFRFVKQFFFFKNDRYYKITFNSLINFK